MDAIRAKKIRTQLDQERSAVRSRIRLASIFPRGVIGRSGEEPTDPIVTIDLSYDREDDSLFGTMDPRIEAFTEETDTGLLLRCRLDNYQPVGFELLDVNANSAARALLTGAFPETDSVIRTGHELKLSMRLGEAENRFRQLIPNDWPTSNETLDRKLYG